MSLILVNDITTNYFRLMKNLILIFVLTFFQFYEKSTSQKDKLNPKFKIVFLYCDKIFSPILNTLNRFIKPINIGTNIQLSVGSFIISFILLICLIF
jgi:hypothetical protein